MVDSILIHCLITAGKMDNMEGQTLKKASFIILIGFVAGLLDLIPLILAAAPVFNMVSVVVFWIVTATMIHLAKMVQKPFLNGLLISTLLMIPLALAVAATNPKDLIPMMLMAVILGPCVGFCIGKFIKK